MLRGAYIRWKSGLTTYIYEHQPATLSLPTTMAEVFGEHVAPTDAIRDILRGYPFSIGLLREILQNSDDAKATEQV